MKRILFIATLFLPACIGCTPYDPNRKDVVDTSGPSPFQQENTPYTLAVVIDPKACDRMVGSAGSTMNYMMRVKDLYFRERAEPKDRVIIAVPTGKEAGVVWDGKVKTFKTRFANPAENMKSFLSKYAQAGDAGAYDGISEVFEYLLDHRAGKGKMAVMVFSEFKNTSSDPKKSRARLVETLSQYSKAGGHVAFYWMTKETSKELKAIGKEAGLQFVNFIADPDQDPVLPTFVDGR